MSGFLPEGLANWALGGAGQGDNGDDHQAASSENNETQAAPISEQDMRAKRMARLAALEKKNSSNAENVGSNDMDVDKSDAAEPMQVDPDEGKKTQTAAATAKVVAAKESSPSLSAPAATPKQPKNTVPDVNMAEEPAQKKPKSPSDPLARLRRKKILLLRRVLQVTFGNEASDRTPACVHLQLDDDEVYNTSKSPNGVNIGHITDLLVSRLSLSPSSRSLETIPPQKPGLIAYLAGCHKRAGEEWKDLKQKKKGDGSEEELCGLLEEIRKQVVSYAASSLQLPDLFELGGNSCLQLARCLSTTATDPSSSVTFDVMGKNTSFYYCVCEELHSQDPDAFETMVADIAKCITDALSECKSLLDESPQDASGLGGNGLLLTSALRELCTNKKAASCLTKVPSFLLPPADSPQASEWVGGPPPPQIPRGANPNQINFIRRMQEMSNSRMRRSGKGLEKDTVLGNVLRLGLPWKHESVLSSYANPVRRSPKDIDQISDGHRRQLELYQSKCNELIRQLVVAGEQPRKKVIQWLTDALLVNAKADAIEKDPTKISSEELLYNLSAVLLKLCDPFVSNPDKAALVDPGFVTSPKSHGGVYELTGDNALTRLGDNVSHSEDEYNPKNSFIPLCFFFCSRALALSIVPGMSSYDSTSRHVSHMAWRIRSANGDIFSDRRFNHTLQVKYGMGIVVKSPTYATDVFRFYNAVAGFLLRLDSDQLKTMPEHLVSDACAVLDFASDHTTGLLSGIDFGNSFRLTVKLLSKDCAKFVRNYNLRASLGDILHDVFLPGDGSHRNDIPNSVICDPLSGGRPYLVSDKMCQDTLAPSLLLLYGEVETTGFYEKSSHRVKIAALLKYLWDSPEHKSAFRKIAEDQESFITFANGIINDMNDKFAGVMEKLPAIRTVQLQMANPQEWAAISEEERETILERHEENERSVENTLKLCDTVLKMLGFLNTDKAIRDMFLLPDMCPRLANMLLFVLTKLVGSRGLDLKVDNPEKYNFRPKEMLQNVCVVFSSFADANTFQAACAKSGYYTPDLLSKSVKTCRKLGLLVGESMDLFEKLEGKVEEAAKTLGDDEEIYEDAPDEFLDPLMSEFMIDPVILPTSNNVVDRATIQQHLLNDPTDPFNRKPLSIDDVVPAEELKEKMKAWLDAKRAAKGQN